VKGELSEEKESFLSFSVFSSGKKKKQKRPDCMDSIRRKRRHGSFHHRFGIRLAGMSNIYFNMAFGFVQAMRG
jgi:hypothetical protein